MVAPGRTGTQGNTGPALRSPLEENTGGTTAIPSAISLLALARSVAVPLELLVTSQGENPQGNSAVNQGRLLVTGGSGFLGRRIVHRASDFETVLVGSWRHPDRVGPGPQRKAVVFDLGNEEETERRIIDLAPSAIVHTAAVNPGGPEDRMEAVNARGSAAVARAATHLGCKLVHVSTDVVHNGSEAPYADDAPPKPLWVYGRTKAEGEAAVRRLCPDAVIVRTSLIYGLNEVDRVTSGFMERLQNGETLTLFTDQIRQPIWVETLAEALLELLRLPVSGFFNVAGSQALARNEIAERLLDFWSAPDGKIELVRSADLGIQRPRDLRLDLSRARGTIQTSLPGMDAILERVEKPHDRVTPLGGKPKDRPPGTQADG